MGNNQTKNRRKGPSAAEVAEPVVQPLYPNLTNAFPTYGHANMVDFRGTPIPEACFGNSIPNFYNMQGAGPSTAGVQLLYPNVPNQFSTSTYVQSNSSIPGFPDPYFGNMMPNFHNVQSNYCNPVPSAPPPPPEGELMRAEITSIVQSVMMKQEVEMQTRQPEDIPQKSRRRNKRNNKSTHNNCPEKKPCPNADEGCQLYFKPEDMQLHLKECLFKDYACPLNGVFGPCAWQGKVKDMRHHFETKHPTNIGHVKHLIFLGSLRIIHFVEIGSYKFLVHIKLDEIKRNIFVGVQLYSTQICASRWSYEFEFRGPMMANMKVENTCIAAGVPIDKFDKPQCGMLIMTPCVLNAFKNGTLKFQYSIMTVKGSNKE